MHWSRGGVRGELPAIRSHTATVVKHKILIIGGCDTGDHFNDLLVLDTDIRQIYKPILSGEQMGGRRAHTANLIDKKIFIFGGGDGPNYFNDLWTLDLGSFTFAKCSTGANVPCPRRAHTAEIVDNKIYYFGGGDGIHALNDVNILDPETLSWSLVKSRGSGVPKGRGYHHSALLGKAMYIFGGSDGKTCFSGVNFLDTASNVWYGIKCHEEGMLAQACTVLGNYIVAFGGHTSTAFSNDCKLFDIRVNKWLSPSISGAKPTMRGYHTLSLCDHRLWSIGGYDSVSSFNDVNVLDIGYHSFQEFVQIRHQFI